LGKERGSKKMRIERRKRGRERVADRDLAPSLSSGSFLTIRTPSKPQAKEEIKEKREKEGEKGREGRKKRPTRCRSNA